MIAVFYGTKWLNNFSKEIQSKSSFVVAYHYHRFIHPIFKWNNEAFKVSFKLPSKSVFLTTFDQSQKDNVETVKQGTFN